MPLPILYSFRRCPYAIRARYILTLLDVPVQLREVVLKDKPNALLELGGRTTVPQMVLSDGGRLEESLDIIHYALQHTGKDSVDELWPSTPLKRIKINTWVSYNDTRFKYWLDRYKYSDRHDESESFYRAKAEVFIKRLEKRLSHQAFVLSTASPTIADVCLFPFIRQFVGVDTKWFETSEYANVRRWLNWFLESTEFKAVMTKFEKWQPEQDVVLFPAQAK
ncbi:glutathione S-transferase [Marinomonas mediterranea]|jgi:Glutathione S-transferase|nr:glutathione S-transferase [Marinomonas mediterranea]WCN15519.1 glutathione S-transferase [Marinomonas mediterranea]WCN19604.1 glutathione S-transferase [Marinomonas mediterranea MMB-1]